MGLEIHVTVSALARLRGVPWDGIPFRKGCAPHEEVLLNRYATASNGKMPSCATCAVLWDQARLAPQVDRVSAILLSAPSSPFSDGRVRGMLLQYHGCPAEAAKGMLCTACGIDFAASSLAELDNLLEARKTSIR